MADDDRPTADAPPDGKAPDLQSKVSELANRWLEDRFGLKVGDGGIALPDTTSLRDFGSRTEQFVRSFFQGFMEKGSEDTNVGPSVASVGEVATRVALKTAGTVSNAFNDYLRDHTSDGAQGDKPVVIDGRFVAQHGLPLIGKLIQSLGLAFVNDTTAEHIPARTPKVDVKLELFKSVLDAVSSMAPKATEPSKDDPKDPT